MDPAAGEKRALTRENLAACTERVLRHAAGAKPAILLVRWAGRPLIVKDFSGNGWLLRHIYGRWIVAHETRLYTQLDGVAGVPVFRGRLDAFAFAVDYVEATTLHAHRRKAVPASVFDRIGELQERLHERGVVHLDSHQAKNILVTAAGEPYLIDFATSLYLGSGWLGRHLLVPFFARADRIGLLKVKARHCSEGFRPHEARRHRLLHLLGWFWPHTAIRRLQRRRRRRLRRAQGHPRERPKG
jgi:predicted Ser/Thr protein kinase